jgi:hypothetical protein
MGGPGGGGGGGIPMGGGAPLGGTENPEGGEGTEGGEGELPPEAKGALGEPEESVVDDINPLKNQDLFLEAIENKVKLIKKFQEEQAKIFEEVQKTSEAHMYKKKRTILHNMNLSYLEETGELDGIENILAVKNDAFLESEEEK